MTLKPVIYLSLALIVLGLAFIIWQMTAYRVSEPSYTTLKLVDSIEVREYPAIIVAQVKMEGDRYTSINAGFRLLANYIFGNNQEKQKIAMTAPVMQEDMRREKRDKTSALIAQQKFGDSWFVRFVMPAGSSLAQLPKPNDTAVALLAIPPKKYIVIQFSGSSTDENLQKQLVRLLNYCKDNHLKTVGNPIMAFYNPPWILPFLRRNEIMLELK